MRLGKAQIVSGQRRRIEPLIDIAVERQHRLLGFLRRERHAPFLVTRDIERRQLITDAHQRCHLGRRQLPQPVDQQLRLVEETG